MNENDIAKAERKLAGMCIKCNKEKTRVGPYQLALARMYEHPDWADQCGKCFHDEYTAKAARKASEY